MKDIGPQYEKDDDFKAKARLHQSRYRANELMVDFHEYGNRLNRKDAEDLLAYYDAMGVRESLRKRYPLFSHKRDGDLLRSEHIVFNLIAPLADRKELCLEICNRVFGVNLASLQGIEFEYSPQPKTEYLDDATAFDAYIYGKNSFEEAVGIGVEIKYTEKSYPLGGKEPERLADPNSTYWRVTRQSGIYKEGSENALASDQLRQVWRNHMLGLSMKLAGKLSEFHSVTLYPSGNQHIADAVDKYIGLLKNNATQYAKRVSYEAFVAALHGDSNVEDWKAYLRGRYLISDGE